MSGEVPGSIVWVTLGVNGSADPGARLGDGALGLGFPGGQFGRSTEATGPIGWAPAAKPNVWLGDAIFGLKFPSGKAERSGGANGEVPGTISCVDVELNG